MTDKDKDLLWHWNLVKEQAGTSPTAADYAQNEIDKIQSKYKEEKPAKARELVFGSGSDQVHAAPKEIVLKDGTVLTLQETIEDEQTGVVYHKYTMDVMGEQHEYIFTEMFRGMTAGNGRPTGAAGSKIEAAIHPKPKQRQLTEYEKELLRQLNLAGLAATYYGAALPFQDTSAGNCYTFAINHLPYTGTGAGPDGLNPGKLSGYTIDYTAPLKVSSVANAVIADMNKLGGQARVIGSAGEAILSDEYRIAVRVGTKPYTDALVNGEMVPLYEYHFMVQNDDGGWSEKHSTGVSIHHDSGKTPDTLSWNLRIGNTTPNYYDSDIVYLAITRPK
ncbi:hypothetical protein LJC34_06025 [Oscillospiraceae bacterium OttesenSCG-928-G22]|nr:hypothetical protein [Oscillospiraceae bacterium OttesenSCG-928-G22]